jgi:hypothetical protein
LLWRPGRAADSLINLKFRDDHVATIAYSVFPAHRGKGVAPRCAPDDTAGFGHLGLNELLPEIDAQNVAPIGVGEKC